MPGHWTFGQRTAAGFTVTVILAARVGITAAIARQRVPQTASQLAHLSQDLLRMVDPQVAA